MSHHHHIHPSNQAGQLNESAQALQAVASALLNQAVDLLQQISSLGAEEGERILTHESSLIPGSTIGKHLRHSLDHYRLLLDAVPTSSAASGVIEVNYDTRIRMTEIETHPQAALGAFREMDRSLAQAVAGTDLDQDIRLTALTPYHQEFGTTFGRELWFVALHAIHHFSLLRVIATGELHLKVPDNFGVAPSTLAFREYSKATGEKEVPPQKLEQGAEKMAHKVKL